MKAENLQKMITFINSLEKIYLDKKYLDKEKISHIMAEYRTGFELLQSK